MKNIGQFLGVLLILFTLCVVYIIQASGAFKSIKPHFDGEAETIPAPPGVEDLTIDHSDGQLYLSSTDRRNKDASGDIFTFNVSEETPVFSKLGINNIYPDFRPHGISLLKKYGHKYIFAISHEPEASYIYRLQVEEDSLISHKRFSHDLLISPNDLVAHDTASFYFTNDHGLKAGRERTIKDLIMDKNGYVVSYKNGEAKKVSQNMAYANGINISKDGKYLFVSTTTEATLFVYKNEPLADNLELLDKHFTGTGLDNIELDKDGNLFIGAHPKMLKFLGHAKSELKRSPSQVLKIIYLPETDYKFLQEELYLNDGNPLSGSSVGAPFVQKDGTNNIFIGSVFEPKIMKLHRNL
ncbi:MAG: arylesterase/paraoxonase [Arcticibacterium sp.]|jgi:arylesterase/paraoxonase